MPTSPRYNSVTRMPYSRLLLALVAQVSWLLAGNTSAELLPQQVLIEREILHAESHDEPTKSELESSVSSQTTRSALLGIGTSAERADDDNKPVGRSKSVSVGAPNRGVLKNGVRLQNSDVLRVKPGSEVTRHGTQEMVDLINFAANNVAKAYPNARLSVGDISRPQGGRLQPHLSHRAGRDADIGFYLTNESGKSIRTMSFVKMNKKGFGRANGVLYKFDTERNWELVKSFLSSPRTDVQYIFVANPLRDKLIQYAVRTGESITVIRRAQQVLRQPVGSPHYSHFHVRVYCAKDDLPQCTDTPPFYAWHPAPGTSVTGVAHSAADNAATDEHPVLIRE